MRIVNLNEAQVNEIETRLGEYDRNHIKEKINGKIQLGIEIDGKIIAGLDACITAFRILYISTVFVDADYRGKGYGTFLMNEMETRAREMGVNIIRLDTFSWQGKEFYEALHYEIAGSYENAADGYAEYFFLKRIE